MSAFTPSTARATDRFRRYGPYLWVLPLALAACNLAPKYHRPDTPVADSFKGTGGPAPASGWKFAEPKDDALRSKWWEAYNDPILNSLEDQVKINNQSIIEAEANYRNARALVMQARSSLFPTISTSPSFQRARSSTTSHSSGTSSSTSTSATSASTTTSATASTPASAGSGPNPYNNFTLPFDASYEVDLWGQIRNEVAMAQASAEASAADVETAILTTQAELATDYFELRSLDQEIKIYKDTIASYRADLDLTKNLFANGIDSDEDVAEAESQLATTIAQASDVQVSRDQYEHAIAVLLGKNPSGFTLAVTAFRPGVPQVPVAIPSQLLERRPDIASAERKVFSANAQIGVARCAYFPTLSLAASAGFQSSASSKLFDWPSRFWSVGPTLGATLFDWGARESVTDQARAQYDAAVASYRGTVLAAFQDVEDNLSTLATLDHESHEQDRAVQAAQHRLDLAMQRYRLGIDSYLNVTVAQTALLTNQQAQLQVQERQLAASIGLIRSLGGGWDDSVKVDSRGVPQLAQ